MLLRRSLWVLCVLAASAGTRTVRAQTSVHGVGSFSLAYTDNMLSAPSDPPPGQLGPIPAWFAQVSPGILLVHDGSRSRYTLSYEHPFTYYFDYPDYNSHSDMVTGRGIFTLTPVDELVLGVNANRASTRLTTLNAPGQAAPQPTLTGDNVLLTLEALESFTHEFNPQWQGLQAASVGWVHPLETVEPQPNRWNIRLGLGTEFTEGPNAYAVLGETIYNVTNDLETQGITEEGRDELIWTLRGRWRRDLTLIWSTELTLGLAAATDTEEFPHGVGAVVGSGAIRYDFDHYNAELMVERTVQPNLITAQTYVIDQARLMGGVPVWSSLDLLLHASTGIARNRVLDLTYPAIISTFDTWTSDIAIGWHPGDGPQVSLRYQHIEQIGYEDDFAPTPSYAQNTVMLTAGMMWPTQRLRPIPAPGQAARVDRTDSVPVGEGERRARPRAR